MAGDDGQPGASASARWARVLLAAAVVLGLWAIVIAVTGGVRYDLGLLRLSSRSAIRPAVIAVILAAIAWRLGYRGAIGAGVRHAKRLAPIAHPAIASAAAGGVLVLGLMFGTRVAGGSDEFGYISQSALWLEGNLRVDQGIAARMPWPRVDETFTPLGYRPVDGHAMVPTYPPGLPLLMAASRLLSTCGPYVIAPVCGALLVLFTYGLGRRFFSPTAALVAAALTAASPTALIMALSPASDVPCAAFWIGALFVAGPSWPRALGAGLLAGAAVAIRPNLSPLAAFPWMLAVGLAQRWRARGMATAAYIVGLMPFVLLVGWVNNQLHGSPLTSGYGSLSELFAVQHAPVNVARYSRWWFDSQGMLAFVFIAGLAFRPTRERLGPLVLMAFAATVFALYAFYLPFNSWGFLRFLLPAIPIAFLAGADAVERLVAPFRPGIRAAALATFAIVSLVHAVEFNRREGVLYTADGEQKYADAGLYVARFTPPEAIVLSSQHSGSIRYYSGRLTLRYDLMDKAWLDRAIALLEQQGRPVYALLDDWEEPVFRERFVGQQAVGSIENGPLASSRGGRLLFYRMAAGADGKVPARIPRTSSRTCWEIAPSFSSAGRAEIRRTP